MLPLLSVLLTILRCLFCLCLFALALGFPLLRFDVAQELAQINVDHDRLPVSAQVDGLSEEPAVDDAARPAINRVVCDFNACSGLLRQAIVDGEGTPVLGASEHVTDQIRLSGDLFVEIMGRERGQFVSCCEDRPCDARCPGTQRTTN